MGEGGEGGLAFCFLLAPTPTGAEPNAANGDGETALMLAARSGSVEVAKLLLAKKADVNAREAWREQTALMWAAGQGHAEAVKLLLERGAQADLRDDRGLTALDMARQGSHAAVVALLAPR